MLQYVAVCCSALQCFSSIHKIHTVGEKEVSLQEIRSGFEFVPRLFGIVLRGGYL